MVLCIIDKKLAAVFEDTTRMCMENRELIENIKYSKDNQKVILENNKIIVKKDLYKNKADVIVSKKRSFEASSAYIGKVAVLNFASHTHPGGGVKFGSRAQEEALCRVSTLYFNLIEKMDEYYLPHRELIKITGKYLFNDDIIYTPKVTVFKDDIELNELNNWFKVDVITCAAPDLRYQVIMKDTFVKLMKKRLKRILDVAISQDVEFLILGAFGCGIFRNPPELVAQIFKEVVKEYLYCFKVVEFAIYCKDDDENYRIFADVFKEI